MTLIHLYRDILTCSSGIQTYKSKGYEKYDLLDLSEIITQLHLQMVTRQPPINITRQYWPRSPILNIYARPDLTGGGGERRV